MWLSPLGICVASRLFCPLHCGAFGFKRLSRGGKSTVEVYIFSALHWESLRYYCFWQILMRYLRNCGLEFWYCGISKHAEFLVIGWAIFSMVVSNYSIVVRGFTVFGIPLAALQSFFSACVYFCYKTGFDSVSDTVPSCGVRKLYALLVPNNIPMIICPMIISYAVEPINGNN